MEERVISLFVTIVLLIGLVIIKELSSFENAVLAGMALLIVNVSKQNN